MYQITDKKVQDYLRNHLKDDPALFALKASPFQGVSPSELSIQLKGLQIAKSKLPHFYSYTHIKYPQKISLEQCSSELTAEYKSTLVDKGENMADLSGGFGIDFYHLSKKFESASYIDPNCELLEIVKFNLSGIDKKRRNYFCLKAEEFLAENSDTFDLIFVDPSRRSKENKKVVLWQDLLPDLISLYPVLKKKTKQLMIKGSPMIDVSSCIKSFPDTTAIHVVSVGREVKEVIISIDFQKTKEDPTVVCAILNNSDSEAIINNFNISDLKEKFDSIGEASHYLYDPHPVFLKAGVENKLGKSYGLKKIAPNTNFFTSDNYVEQFPGRVFEILEDITSLKETSKKIQEKKINVITKNIPATPDEILKKMKKKAGGNKWLIAYKNHKNAKVYNLCTRIK